MAAPEVGLLYQGVAKASAAFKLMKSMGWEEGQGLGKNKQGISTHVRVVKKFDNTGIGIAEARKEASNWSVNTAVFDAILKNLNVKANEQNLQSVEEPADAGASKQGSGSNKGKEPANGEEPQALKTARPQGRYKKREAGKCVKSYSESDLSAILGVAHTAVAAKPPQASPAVAVPASPGSSEVEAEEESEKGVKAKKGRKDKTAKKEKKAKSKGTKGALDSGREAKRPPVQAEQASVPKKQVKKSKSSEMKHSQSESALATSAQQTEEAAPSAAAPRELPPDWWGHRSGFVMGGVLGSASERKVKEREPGFSEADQEGLYHLVNNTATSGKKGLGTGSQPKKVAGARWKGQKVTFEDVEEHSDGASAKDREGGASERAEESKSSSGSEDASAGSSAKKGKGKRKRGEDDTEEEGGVQAIKWKKILLDTLKKEGPSLRIEVLLRRAVRKACKLSGGKEEDKAKLTKKAQAKVKALDGKCLLVEDGMARMK